MKHQVLQKSSQGSEQKRSESGIRSAAMLYFTFFRNKMGKWIRTKPETHRLTVRTRTSGSCSDKPAGSESTPSAELVSKLDLRGTQILQGADFSTTPVDCYTSEPTGPSNQTRRSSRVHIRTGSDYVLVSFVYRPGVTLQNSSFTSCWDQRSCCPLLDGWSRSRRKDFNYRFTFLTKHKFILL